MNDVSSSSLKVLFGIIVWTLIVFFVTRWFWLWYWKISRRTAALEGIEQHLYEITLLLQGKSIDEDEDKEREDNKSSI